MRPTSNPAEAERATVPRIVLPITSRGLEITVRTCWVLLGAAMAAAAALILYLNRGTVFYLDELLWVYGTPGLGAEEAIEPHNGHLIATTRLAYKAILETVGASYLSFRLLGVAALVLSAGLFYALAKRRLGPLPALAPAVVLLFCGAAWGHVVIPIGFPILLSVAAGLGALLALERDDRAGEIGACALLVVSVATYTSGLAFVAGAALSILLRGDRWRRLWIVAVPIVLYAAWFLWSLSSAASPEGEGRISNLLLIPAYAADSLATALAAVTGVGLDFTDRLRVSPAWGQIVAVVAVAALAVRLRRGPVHPMLWTGIGILLAYWILGALVTDAGSLQLPGEVRYIYVGAVGVLLVASAAATGARFTRGALLALLGVTAVSLATNVAMLRDGASAFRTAYSPAAQAQFAILELAREHVDPRFDPEAAVPEFSPVGSPAAFYLAVSDRYGSLAYSLEELRRQGEGIREGADQVLAAALELRLEPVAGGAAGGECTTGRGEGGGAINLELPRGGATLRARGVGIATLTVARFGSLPTTELGSLPAGEAVALRIPEDSAPEPWRATVLGARAVEVCASP